MVAQSTQALRNPAPASVLRVGMACAGPTAPRGSRKDVVDQRPEEMARRVGKGNSNGLQKAGGMTEWN